jgi:hypothetical protein
MGPRGPAQGNVIPSPRELPSQESRREPLPPGADTALSSVVPQDFDRVVTDQLKSVQPIQGAIDAVNQIIASGVTVAVASNYTGETKDAWMRVANHHGFKARERERERLTPSLAVLTLQPSQRPSDLTPSLLPSLPGG